MPRSNETSEGVPAQRRRVALAALGLVLLVLVLYAGVGDHDFVNYDDDLYVTANSHVQRGLTPDSIGWASTTTHASNWHPLTWLSHMLDVELYGLDPGGHHVTSVVLHAVNTVLLLLALGMLTGRFWPALLVALLFAVHPLRVESVAWVAERKDVLAGLFWMLSLLAYAAWVGHRRPARYALLVGCLALGLMAKPMLVTLPFVLLLLDVWPLRRTEAETVRKLVIEKLPLFVLSAASIAITLVAQRRGGAMQVSEAWSFAERLTNALVAAVAYLWKTVWPTELACFYPHPAAVDASGTWVPAAAGAGLLLAVVTALAIVARRRRPYFTVGWLWYLGVLFPVIGIVQVGGQAMADRYAYLPLIGIYVAAAWGLADWVGDNPRRRFVAVPAVVIVVAALATVTWQQIAPWKDGQTLFEHALRVTRNNYVAHNNLGSVFESRGDLEQAADHFGQALRIRNDFAPAHNNLGLVLTKQGELPGAVEHLERAVRLDPGYAEAHANLGAALQRQGDFARAAEQFESAVRLDPDHARAHNNLGIVFESRGELERAAARYERALEIAPEFAEAHSNLGNIRLAKGDLAGARSRYESALRIRPDFAGAHNNLALVFARMGDHRRAVYHYRRAIELQPAMMRSAIGLIWLLATSADAGVRDGAEALTRAGQCVETTFERDPVCLEALAAAHAELGEFDEAVRRQTQAVSLVPDEHAAGMRSRLELYRSRQPYREPTQD